MKKNEITISSGSIHDPILEELIQKKDAELKELARKNAKHFAKQNLPSSEGGNLQPYVGEIKTGYEKLASDIMHHLQPEANFPEAKLDADHFREKDKNLETEIKEREQKNRNDEYEMGDFNHGSIGKRMLWAGILTIIVTVGEIIFNTKALQIMGESMLFSLVISACVSISVLIFAHVIPLYVKEEKSQLKRRLITIGSLVVVTILFYVLAILRSDYLATHDVHISPTYFVIFNLFFYIVSSLFSFFILPTWSEIKDNTRHLKTLGRIKRRKKEIERLKKEREEIKATILKRTKERLRIIHYANYAAERIRKMYFEAIETFKTTNLTYRSDKTTPDCFSDRLAEPDITTITF